MAESQITYESQPEHNQSVIPYDPTGLENKIIDLDKSMTEGFGLTYDNQLANLDPRDYMLARKVGQHIQTLISIEKELGVPDSLKELKREYQAKVAYMLTYSKSKDMAMLKTLRSTFNTSNSSQRIRQDMPEAPREKRRIGPFTLPI